MTVPEGFVERNNLAIKLLDFVGTKTKDEKLRLEAKKYLVIASVSAMEIYFREMAIILVDSGLMAENFKRELKEITFTLADLPEIMDRDISLGEIVSVSRSFQNIYEINDFFSSLLNVKFANEIRRVTVTPEEGEPYTLDSAYPDFWVKVEDITQLRHSIVHYGYIPKKFKRLGLKRLIEMWINLLAFVSAADKYLIETIVKKLEERDW